MNYHHMPLHCRCGEVPESIAEVGFTEDHQLVVHWWCTRCERIVYVAKPLAECWHECPSPRLSLDRVLQASSGEIDGEEDARFLRSIGVRV